MAGSLLVSASAGIHFRKVNGCGILASVGLLPASSLGAGLRITTAAGFLMLPAAAGFTHLAFSDTADMGTEGMGTAAMAATPENQSTLSIRLTLCIGRPPLFSFAKMANSASFR
jgi:hypothetical protein